MIYHQLSVSVIECVCVGKGMLKPWRMSDSEFDGTRHSASVEQNDSPAFLPSRAGGLLFGPLLGLSYTPKKKDVKARRSTQIGRYIKQKCNVVKFYHIAKRDNPTFIFAFLRVIWGFAKGATLYVYLPPWQRLFSDRGRTRGNTNYLFLKTLNYGY